MLATLLFTLFQNELMERLIPCFPPNLFQCYASAPGSQFLCSLSILKSVFQKKINTNFRPVFVINPERRKKEVRSKGNFLIVF
jgi:hypothetical protein